MRIRKHVRISTPPTLPSSITPNTPSTSICELNRSPWDVMDFFPPSHNEYQVDLNDNHTCNDVRRDSAGYTPNSTLASLREQYLEEIAKKKVEEESDEEKRLWVLLAKEKAKKNVKIKRDMDDYIGCTKTDGKGWQCKNEAKEGQLLCEHHLTQLKSYHYNYANCPRKSLKLKGVVPKATARAAAKRSKKRPRTPSSPTDFYYYSGFGPLWGRKRGNETQKEEWDVANDFHPSSSSSLVQVPNVHDHNHGDSDDDDDENSTEKSGGKKRFRKPIKERSLKSLF